MSRGSEGTAAPGCLVAQHDRSQLNTKASAADDVCLRQCMEWQQRSSMSERELNNRARQGPSKDNHIDTLIGVTDIEVWRNNSSARPAKATTDILHEGKRLIAAGLKDSGDQSRPLKRKSCAAKRSGLHAIRRTERSSKPGM